MLKKKIVSASCMLVLAQGLFSVFASKGAQEISSNILLAPQVATLIVNEYLADPGGSSSGDLEGDANGDGTRDSAADEFVELVNTGSAPLEVGLFTVSDGAQVRFTIPAGKVIPAGESALVFGGGTPTGAFGNATANGLVFTAGSGGLSLNNGGDTITIKDNLAATVTSVTFGSSEGGANQSITRSPDISGSFTTHSTAAGSGGALFSPGARVNGAPFTTTDPVIASISPDGAITGSGDVSMTVNGINFEVGSTIRMNGSPVPTSIVSTRELVGQIPSSATDGAGIRLITVQNPSGAISNAVAFVVLGQIGINEFMADPADGLIGDANGDGNRDSAQDEFVEIVNRTGAPIEAGGFTLRDADSLRFTFPPGAIIPSGEAAVVFGGGNPQGDFGNARANGLLFTASLSLNNGGDTVELRNQAGITIEAISFGTTEGNANQSINRNPDLSGITFVTHSSISASAGRLFSPGTLVDGSPFSVGPRIASIAPASAGKDAPPFDLALQGSGFETSSTILIDAQAVTTSFINPTQLVGRVPASVTASSGSHPVQVRNEGGNQSNSAILTIVPPPPVLRSITPRFVTAGSGTLTIFLTGLNFSPGATASIDEIPIATTFVSAFELRATVPASFTAATGSRAIIVRNSDGKQSAPVTLEIVPPATVITSISPANAVAGGSSFEMLVRGSNFKNNAVVLFGDADLATTFRTQSELVALVPASLITAPGVHAVSVRNSGEPQSNEAVFQVFPDAPLIASLDPPSVIEGSGEVTVMIAGQKFQPGAVVRIIEATRRGAALGTTFVSPAALQARVPGELTQASGTVILAVENPDFGLSNTMLFRVLIRDPLVINEYLPDPADGLAGDANGDGTRSTSADEFVELLNRTGESIDLSGYKILDAEAVRHVFAAGTIVPPFEAAVVFGGGTPTGPFGNATDNHLVFKASTGGLSLNNGGDVITLQDPQGRIVEQIRFGTAEGNAGQSVNRDPDGDGSTFSFHNTVAVDASRLFSPGSKASGQTFTIKPIISKISPATIRVGSSQFALTVSGSKFLPGSVVLSGDTPLATTFRSETEVEAQVASSVVAEGGRAAIRVKNPRGERSEAAVLLIIDDPPLLLAINPALTGTGAESLEIAVSGERFQRGAGVQVQGQAIETRFISSTSLVAVAPSSLFAHAAELSLRVLNADGNQSNALAMTIENGPLITRLSRGKVKTGSGAFDMIVVGVAFKPGVILFANDIALSTTFINEGSLTARIPAEITGLPGALRLQARNPDGGRSNTATLKVK